MKREIAKLINNKTDIYIIKQIIEEIENLSHLINERKYNIYEIIDWSHKMDLFLSNDMLEMCNRLIEEREKNER